MHYDRMKQTFTLSLSFIVCLYSPKAFHHLYPPENTQLLQLLLVQGYQQLLSFNRREPRVLTKRHCLELSRLCGLQRRTSTDAGSLLHGCRTSKSFLVFFVMKVSFTFECFCLYLRPSEQCLWQGGWCLRMQWGVSMMSIPLTLTAPVLPGQRCMGSCLGHLQRIRLWLVDSCCLRSVWARQGYRKGEEQNGVSGLVSRLASRCPDLTPAGSSTLGDSKHNNQPLLQHFCL